MATAEKKKKNALVSYLEASYEELRKVAWPTRNRAIRLTFLVLGFVFAIALIIGVLDFVFGIGQRALLDLAPDRVLPTVQTTPPVDTGVEPHPGDTSGSIVDVGDISVTTGDEQPVEVDVAPVEEMPAATATPASAAEETPS